MVVARGLASSLRRDSVERRYYKHPAYMACGAKGVYGRAKGTVRSKAEPWNERRVANVSLGTKGDYVTTCRPDLVIADLTRSFLPSAVRYPGRAIELGCSS